MCYIGSELWESKFDGLLILVKEYIVDLWEIRKTTLAGDYSVESMSTRTGLT